MGKVSYFWSFLSGKSLPFSGKYSPLDENAEFEFSRGEYFPENCKLFPDKNDQKWVTFPNLLSKLSKKGKLFPDEYPGIM